MRKGRKVRLDLISGDTITILFLGILFFLGGILGCWIAANIHGEGGAALQEYLNAYLLLAGEGEIEVSFVRVVWERMRDPAFVLLIGVTAVGIVGVPVLFGLSGFRFAFSVACFCRMFGGKGLIPALFLFGLPALLWIPAFFVLGLQAVGRARWSLGRCFGGRDASIRNGMDWWCCGLCGVAFFLCAAFECFILPVLVGASARFVL